MVYRVAKVAGAPDTLLLPVHYFYIIVLLLRSVFYFYYSYFDPLWIVRPERQCNTADADSLRQVSKLRDPHLPAAARRVVPLDLFQVESELLKPAFLLGRTGVHLTRRTLTSRGWDMRCHPILTCRLKNISWPLLILILWKISLDLKLNCFQRQTSAQEDDRLRRSSQILPWDNKWCTILLKQVRVRRGVAQHFWTSQNL